MIIKDDYTRFASIFMLNYKIARAGVYVEGDGDRVRVMRVNGIVI